jgi:hypothetical protein
LRREWIGLVLVLLGLLRAGWLVAHDPVVGYGGQADMARTSACIGLFPAVKDPTAATPDAPTGLYETGGARSGLCYFSTEIGVDAAVIGIAKLVHNDSRAVRLQWIGYAKLTLLAITALLVAFALHRNPAAALLHGVVFLVVMTDPVATLWFDTLYTEFGTIWGLYALVGATCVLAVTERARYAIWGLLLVGIVALALSREQYAILAPLLVAAAAPWLWDRSAEMAVASFLLALAACVVSYTIVPRPGFVTTANRADTYLGVVLPASSRPQRARAILALPDRCETMVGATWSMQRGENLQQACPELFLLSGVSFLRFVDEEPEVLARAVARVVPAMQALTPAYLGTLEGATRVKASELPWWAFSPLDAAANRAPGKVFTVLVMIAMLAAPIAFLAAIAWARPSRGDSRVGLLVGILLGVTVVHGVLTTVFGGGLNEAARHFIPGALALAALVIATVAGVPGAVARWIEAPRARAIEMVASLAFALVAILSCATALRWAEVQPLAIGALEFPAGREATAAPLKLRGWALDPRGVESVQVELGKLKREAQIGEDSPDVKAAYPGYPDRARARFTLELGADDLAAAGAPEELPMRITVRSAGGAVTEIDRRRLDFPKPPAAPPLPPPDAPPG